MEAQNLPKFDIIEEAEKQVLESKEYDFQISEDKFKLKISTYTPNNAFLYQENQSDIYLLL